MPPFLRYRSSTDTWDLVQKYKDRSGKWRQKVLVPAIPNEREAKSLLARRKKLEREKGAGVLATTPTVAEALKDYLDDLGARVKAGTADASSWSGYESKSRLHVVPFLGEKELGDLTAGDVQAMIDHLSQAKKLGPQSIAHCVGVLGATINRARVMGDLAIANVAEDPRLKKPQIVKVHRETLEPHEMRPVIAEWPEHLRPFVGLCLIGGTRPKEAAKAPPEIVELARHRVVLQDKKRGKPRIIPMKPGGLLEELLTEALKHATAELLFPGTRGENQHSQKRLARMLRSAMVRAAEKGCTSLVTHWELKCRRKGCGHHEDAATMVLDKPCPECGFKLMPVGQPRRVRFYDLRHTTTTNLLSRGIAPGIESAVVGHRPEVAQGTYLHLRPGEALAVAEAMEPPPALPAHLAGEVLSLPKRKGGPK